MRERRTPRQRAISNYYRFSTFNVISFNFLAGNIIVLYALRLGAGNILVGVIAASYQITFIFSIIGRRLLGKFGAVKLFGYFWFFRYLLMVPVLLTALPGLRDHPGLTLAIVGLCAFGFNVAKGIGLTAVKPIVGEIPSTRERGSFLSNNQLIIQLGAIGTGLIMAWVLGPSSGLGRYAMLLSIGVITGFIAAYFILRLPEPSEAAQGSQTRFSEGLKNAFADRRFRSLLLVNMVTMFVGTMAEAFVLVFFKSNYGYGDQAVVLFTAIGSVGAAVMAVFSRSVVDRTGAKPLIFTFAAILCLTLVGIAVAPGLAGPWVYLYPGLVFFFFAMGRIGTWVAADNYFYSITHGVTRLDVGIVFGIGTGAAGALGSLLGGVLLSGLQRVMPAYPVLPYTLYFGLAAVIAAYAVVASTRMEDVDAIPIPDALAILVSPRDLRAIRLLNRLRRSRTEPEEQKAVRALRDSTSVLTLDELSQRIRSPSLLIRTETLIALRDTPLTRKVEDLLMADVKSHPFTTAYLSAELLGSARVHRAIPLIRQAVESRDSLLSARAMLALARMGDRASIPRMETLLSEAPNVRVAIHAVKALETLASTDSLPLILRELSRTDEPFQRDEYILSCARLLGFFDWFYPLYLEFLEDPSEALRSLADAATEAGDEALDFAERFVEAFKSDAGTIATLVTEFLDGRKLKPGSRRRSASGRPPVRLDIKSVLLESCSDPVLLTLERYRFLLLATLVALSLPADR